MSRIVIKANPLNPGAELVRALRAVTGGSLLQMKSNLQDGLPIFVGDLFLNDHVEIDRRIRGVLTIASRFDVSLEIFELEPSESFQDNLRNECLIDFATLMNILDEARDKFS